MVVTPSYCLRGLSTSLAGLLCCEESDYSCAVLCCRVGNCDFGYCLLLVDYFTEQICAEQGIAPKSFDNEAIKSLQAKQWTGNIRQLRNVVERLIILAGSKITKEDVEVYA